MLKIYDSYENKKREFKEIEKGKVIMYVCGLTPYDSAHIGHARTYVAFDVLKRYLIYKGYKVYHIQNVTDVDDKIIKRAKERGEHVFSIADRFQMEATQLFDELNIIRADIYPRVSQYIEQILDIVEGLVAKGIAYETETGVYFDVDKFENYGKLSKQSKEELKKHRIEPDKTKKNSYDFALWKKTKNEIVEWKSRFGKGRPGWHIECSAMSLSIAKRTLDIHGGARDLIFPHHENEIAQSEAYTGKKFVNYWMHTGFLTVEGVKMSKSLGNFITLKDALKKWKGEELRMFFISKKYSSAIDFSEKGLEDARESLNRIYTFYDEILENEKISKKEEKDEFYDKIKEYEEEFIEAIEDDLDTPRALAVLFNFIREGNKYLSGSEKSKETLKEMKKFMDDVFFILGIGKRGKKSADAEKMIELILEIRDELRKRKLYELSDEIREKLNKAGIEIFDDKGKTRYRLK